MVVWQSLRLDGRKVCNIKMVGISQVNAILLRFVPCAVNPPPFDKGGKCGGAGRGIVRFWKGWCGARDCCPFAIIVRMERVGATGGASKARMP